MEKKKRKRINAMEAKNRNSLKKILNTRRRIKAPNAESTAIQRISEPVKKSLTTGDIQTPRSTCR